MKRIATAALAVCLLSGTSALAEPNHNHGGPPGGGPHPGPSHAVAPQVHAFHPGPGGPSFRTQSVNRTPSFSHPQSFAHTRSFTPQTHSFTPQVHTFRAGPRGFNPGGPMVRPRTNVVVHNNINVAQSVGPRGPSGFHPRFGAPGFHPGGARPHYSPQFFPHSFNVGSRFHWRGGRWSGPPGFYYRHWGYGQFWPLAWLAPQWFINDYWYYDLPVPPLGYEWVRNGPDALLVNQYTGMVVEVVPDIFY